MVRLCFLSTIILFFVFQPTAVIADLSEKDLIAKFDKAASSIIDKLVRINLKVRTTPPLLFYAPYRNLKQTVIPKKAFSKFNLILEEKLLAYGENKIRLALSRDRFVKTNKKFKAADYIMTPKIALKNQDVTLVFRIIDAKHNETVISETVYLQKVSPQLLTEETNAMSLKEALDDIAEKFASQNPDMKTLYYSSLSTSENGGFSTKFDRFFTRELVTKIEENIANPLTGKKLKLKRYRGAEKAISEGEYQLQGVTESLGKNFYVFLKLSDFNKSTTPWSGYVRKNSLEPQIAYEDYSSKAELENIQTSDKLGLVNLTLTTSLGDAPTLEFGDKWHLKVKTDKRTWLYCYYIQVDRKVLPIYPNPVTWKNYGGPQLNAQQIITIPRKNVKNGPTINFTTSGPAGFELIKCFATSRDISRDLPEHLLAKSEDTTILPIEGDIHKNLSDIFTRYDPNVTEDSIPVTVIKKRFN